MSTETLTLEEKATNYETMRHIETVRRFLTIFIKELLDRANEHDQSKLASPEVAMFTELTSKLAGTTYGSSVYEEYRKQLGPALNHHYAKNRHHPEHFRDGINDMTLVDIVEMFCDWKAATLRHHDGNLRKSIEKNGDRFGISPQLIQIFENTAALFDE